MMATEDLKPGRPISVTILAGGVLTFCVVSMLGWLNSLELFRSNSLPLENSFTVYLVVRGAFWILASLILAWGLWRGNAWAPRFTFLAVIILIVFYWLERLFLVHPDNQNSNISFSAGVSILAIFLTWWVLSRPPSRAFFGAKHDRRSEH